MVNSIIDEKSGLEIHYGTIYANNVSSFALDDIIRNGTDLNHKEAIEQLKEDFKEVINQFLEDNYLNDNYIDIDAWFESIESSFNDTYESNDSTYLYEEAGYEIEFHTYDNSLIILKSPYVCYAAPCSPCFPNGGYIRDRGDVLTYCLGKDFYDEYSPQTNIIIDLEIAIRNDDL
ncbi:MAG: hypothetical protein PHX08_16050 [Lachnospiraceae bacterium]|nr:hypothetical protein [Lachnospiraceae bacterium]